MPEVTRGPYATMGDQTSAISADISPGESLSRGKIFDVLRNQRRRYALHYLKRNEEPVELGDMATAIAAWENEKPIQAVTSEERKRVYTTLQQTHLPKMHESGVVNFDSSRGTIRTTDNAAKLDIYLEIVPGYEFAWREYYLALGAISTALVAAVWAQTYPFTIFPMEIWAAGITVVMTVSALLHYVRERSMRLGAGEVPPELEYQSR